MPSYGRRQVAVVPLTNVRSIGDRPNSPVERRMALGARTGLEAGSDTRGVRGNTTVGFGWR